jgi:hypothetical protein
VTSRAARRTTAILLGAAVLASATTAAAVWRAGARAEAPTREALAYQSPRAERITTLRAEKLRQAAVEWRGGPVTASTGETVTVLVSESFAPEVTPEVWAEFLVQLVHGPELQELTTYVAPLSEVQEICGSQALGCYSRDRAITLGETLSDGTTGEAVLRHEYGHHIALHRSNEPWEAIDWGPKHWASAANVCARAARREVFPGGRGENYALNPGEAWAEVYRLLDERKAGITTASWQIIAPSFYPTEAMLQAAETDVVQPWTSGQTSQTRRSVARGRVWWIPLSTPLDGSYAITVALPRGGQHEVVLTSVNRRTVIKRAARTGPRSRHLSGTICGQRSPYLKITQKGATGPVAVTVAKP